MSPLRWFREWRKRRADENAPNIFSEVTISPVDPDAAWDDYLDSLKTGEISFENVRFVDPQEGVSREYMPVPRCETCRWWERLTYRRKGEAGRSADRGTCDAGISCGYYRGNDNTPADFGCVQWEAKDGD